MKQRTTHTGRRDWDDLDIDVEALIAELHDTVQGEVRFDRGSRALYATDASNYRHVPIGVVLPKTIDDVVATHAACHRYAAPVLARGSGTSLSGETVNVAVVMDFSKYLHDILKVDPDNKTARVEPGVVHDQLSEETLKHRLVFAPDPSTHAYCTVGGNVGNNSCGVHSVQAQFFGEGARTSDNVAEMEVLTYDGYRMRVGPTSPEELEKIIAAGGRRGQIYSDMAQLAEEYAPLIRERFPDIPRRVSGYNLDELLPENGFNVARALVGTEGTCVTVLNATLKLVHDPPVRTLAVVGYTDIFEAGNHVPLILEHQPLGCEGLDDHLIGNELKMSLNLEAMELLPGGGAYLLIEMGGESRQQADAKTQDLIEDLRRTDHPPVGLRLISDADEQVALWDIRESGLAATAFPPDSSAHWPGWEDSAVPPAVIGPYLRDLKALYDRYNLSGALYGHLGQGCVHSRISFDLQTAPGIQQFRAFMEEAANLCISYGGSLSGEHGDGQARGELLSRMYGEELVEAFRRFKRIWDPQWKMNPGKVVDAKPMDAQLKLDPRQYSPPATKTHFSFAEDGSNFANTTLRCVGVGKCLAENDTMCPSYMVTREEKHTTRGRARMLFEMMQGEQIDRGWRDPEVYDSLELCLSCKGCKTDCPVGVDMATYKSEFLSHYFKGRLRPAPAYVMGLVFVWARLGSAVPHLANLLTQTPVLSGLAKKLGGLAPQRPAPKLASQTLESWFADRDPLNEGGPPVMVWPDTFNNYFHPEAGKATVEVLESAGYQVQMPGRNLCCGRPLYDYGMLTTAKALLRQTVTALRPQIVAGTPIVGIEPSCVAVFREEMTNLMPNDEDAKRLSDQFFTLAEFLEDHNYQPPRLNGRALLHPHCHQSAVMGISAEERLLAATGLEVAPSKAGCCGLAGSFGFEAGDKYDVSVAVGQHRLIPKVNEASEETLLVADGFSCKSQIEHLTSRRALHLAQVLRMAGDGEGPRSGARPEDDHPDAIHSPKPTRAEWLMLGLTGVACMAPWIRRYRRRAFGRHRPGLTRRP